jgi:hypothetical protein
MIDHNKDLSAALAAKELLLSEKTALIAVMAEKLEKQRVDMEILLNDLSQVSEELECKEISIQFFDTTVLSMWKELKEKTDELKKQKRLIQLLEHQVVEKDNDIMADNAIISALIKRGQNQKDEITMLQHMINMDRAKMACKDLLIAKKQKQFRLVGEKSFHTMKLRSNKAMGGNK